MIGAMPHVLRLFTDKLGPRAALTHPLPAAIRAIFVVDGMASIAAGRTSATLAANSGWFSPDSVTFAAAASGAHLLRWELVKTPEASHGIAMGENVASQLTLEAELQLDPKAEYLLRCDKVELPPGGIAYTHTHQGGGIRCLLAGGFNVRVHGETRFIRPGEAWFERGPDPVHAWAPDDRPGHFARVMILPRALKGKSSIRYVMPEDVDKPKPQKYTIFIDEFIELG